MTLTTLAQRLRTGTGRGAHLWTITRKDGRIFRLTDHDSDITHAGAVYLASIGLGPARVQARLGLEPDAASVEGVLDDPVLASEDMQGGLYDGAQVQIRWCDWAQPETGGIVFSGRFGALTQTETGFETDLAGMQRALETNLSASISRTCTAQLGDARCGIDLSLPGMAGAVCDKHFQTCVNRFANGVNFRGFPHVPGPDALIRGPVAGLTHDGGSVWQGANPDAGASG